MGKVGEKSINLLIFRQLNATAPGEFNEKTSLSCVRCKGVVLSIFPPPPPPSFALTSQPALTFLMVFYVYSFLKVFCQLPLGQAVLQPVQAHGGPTGDGEELATA